MARYNKVFAGPVTQNTPQVQERVCTAGILPGTALIESGANFAQAGANALTKVFIAQDNYLALKSVDDAWPANDRIIGMEMLDDQFFNVRIATGTNVVRGVTQLTTAASGKFAVATTGQRVIMIAEETYSNASGSDQLVRARVARNQLVAA